MRRIRQVESWVVYKMTIWGKPASPNAVCEQGEWDEMEQLQPGYHALIRAGIASEAEAERLARESPGGTIEPVRIKERLLARRALGFSAVPS